MFTSRFTRRGIARTLSTLVALTLAVVGGGLAATSASAVAGGAPVDVLLKWAGDTKLKIDWTAPGDTGTAPNHYTVQLRGYDLDSATPAVPVVDVALPDVAFGVNTAAYNADPPNFLSYTASVVLVGADPADISAPGQSNTTVPLPLAVSGMTAVATDNDVTIGWTPHGVDNVDNYQVSLTRSDVVDPKTSVPTDVVSWTFMDVAPGTYTATVKARNSSGNTPVSVEVTVADVVPPVVVPPVVVPPVVVPPVVVPPVVVPPVVVPTVVVPPVVAPKAPSAPRSIKTAVAKHGVVDVRWTAPASINGAKVTRYTVTVGGQEKLTTGTRVSFAGLTKGTYVVKVFATNSAGKSAGSAKVTVSKAKAATVKLTLKAGMRGSDVKALQKKLKMPVQVRTGVLDKHTVTYVKRWQKAHHKTRTGVVNAAMRKALKI